MPVGEYPLMPELAHARYGFRHSLDSALETLHSIGVNLSQVKVGLTGYGLLGRFIVQQDPQAGTRLTPDVKITLLATGLGYFQTLPVGMWDSGGKEEPGTKEIVEIFDDPIQKIRNLIREGGRLFDVRRENPLACARWIDLFGLEPDEWPAHLYEIAVLASSLQRIGGRDEGIRLMLETVLGLPLYQLRYRPSFLFLDEGERSRLGLHNSNLQVDFVVGYKVEAPAELQIVIGPVSIAAYHQFESLEYIQRLESVLALCVPYHLRYSIKWVVLDPSKAPQLGNEAANCRLGVNMHLGTPEHIGTHQAEASLQ